MNRQSTRTYLVAAASLIAVGCGGSGDPPEVARRPSPGPAADGGADAPQLAVPALGGTQIARVPGGTYGPYAGFRESGGVAVWAAPEGDGEARGWFSLGLAADGGAKGEPLRLGDVSGEIGLVAVEPAAGGNYAVLTTARGASTDTVSAWVLAADGQLVAGPLSVHEASGEVIWLDLVETKTSTLALWAIKSRGAADIYARPLGPKGEWLATASAPVRAARAWQAAPASDGVALAWVASAGAGKAVGPVKLLRLGADAAARGGPIELSKGGTASLDLDLVRTGDGWLAAWTDRGSADPSVALVAVAADGKASEARSLAPVLGEQALVRLVEPEGRGPAYVVWEDVYDRPEQGRDLLIAAVRAGKPAAERAKLHITATDGTEPELAAAKRGLVALTLAPVCQRAGSCESADALPTYVELGADLTPRAAEPLRLLPLGGEAAELAWGLSCAGDRCWSLAARAADPAPVFTVQLAAASEHWHSPAARVETGEPPRARAAKSLADTEPLADVARATVGDVELVASITFFDPTTPYERRKTPAPDGRFDPVRAVLRMHSVKGDEVSEHVISYRARSLGGVALAAGDDAKKESLLVWSAIDNGQPQVFTTVVGADGKKLRQRMLTRAKGEVTDVAVVRVADGWVLGWVDERNGDPEVYVTKVNYLLQRVVPERRITSAKGTATGLTLAARGDDVLLAWADARNAEKPGFADIFAQKLSAKDASPIGDASVLAKTAAHSRSPVLAGRDGGMLLAWVEEQSDDDDGVMLAMVDDAGRPERPPVRVSLPDATAGSVGVDCAATLCRVAVAATAAGRGALHGFTWQAGRASKPRRLLGLLGPADQTVVPLLDGDTLIFTDQSSEGRGRLRRLSIDWSR